MCSGVFSFSCFCMDFYSIGLRDDIDGVGISASISTDVTYMTVIYYKFLIMVYLSYPEEFSISRVLEASSLIIS